MALNRFFLMDKDGTLQIRFRHSEEAEKQRHVYETRYPSLAPYTVMELVPIRAKVVVGYMAKVKNTNPPEYLEGPSMCDVRGWVGDPEPLETVQAWRKASQYKTVLVKVTKRAKT
jgi:hypothetical protein